VWKAQYIEGSFLVVSVESKSPGDWSLGSIWCTVVARKKLCCVLLLLMFMLVWLSWAFWASWQLFFSNPIHDFLFMTKSRWIWVWRSYPCHIKWVGILQLRAWYNHPSFGVMP
jgi:hypothetical protein